MQFFTLAVLPEHSAQVPILAKKVMLDRGEDRTHQDNL